jgi:integrase/recombinase XerC
MTRPPAARHRQLEMARSLLAELGITPEQLSTDGPTPAAAPTFNDYVPRLSEAVSPGSRRAYGPYWDRVCDRWGDRCITEPTPLEIKQLSEAVRGAALVRRNSRGGRSAAEHLISALRCLYRHAAMDGLINDADNPAIKVAKPRRLASTRRALTDAQLSQIRDVAASTGNDPELDCLLLRLHTETACRRGGALALRATDLDADLCLIYLREKGGTARWQPVSPTLMRHLLAHHAGRGPAEPAGKLLRYRNGRPLTYRRYDHLWRRVGIELPWVHTQQVSTHWLRHTTLTWVERHCGYAVARAYAGHAQPKNAGTTLTYVQADLQEVAAALSGLTGEPHPLTSAPP